MARIRGPKERRHQPYWEALIRGTVGAFAPRTTIAGTQRLFTTAVANLALGNMSGSGGQFPSDQTYRILAMRVGLHFRAIASLTGLTDFMMYFRATTQLFWSLNVQDKVAMQAPTPYFPLGGGLYGDLGTSTDVLINNGYPSHEAIAKLARSVALPVRQNFYVESQVIACGAADHGADILALTAGELEETFYIDGLHVRDVL